VSGSKQAYVRLVSTCIMESCKLLALSKVKLITGGMRVQARLSERYVAGLAYMKAPFKALQELHVWWENPLLALAGIVLCV
jgi:hypothetical protein